MGGRRLSELVFVKRGTASFIYKHNDTQELISYTAGEGSIFGLEDLIYRMPDEQRQAFSDRKIFFCDYKARGWPKRKFKIKFSEDFVASMLSMPDHLTEWQFKFPHLLNALFAQQLLQLRCLLFNRLTLMA
jgi:hypothetical protein